MVSSTSELRFGTLAELSVQSFLTKIVSTARRNRRLSTKPVGLVKPKEDCMTERLTTSKTDLPQVGLASAVADPHSTSTGHNSKWDHFEIF